VILRDLGRTHNTEGGRGHLDVPEGTARRGGRIVDVTVEDIDVNVEELPASLRRENSGGRRP